MILKTRRNPFYLFSVTLLCSAPFFYTLADELLSSAQSEATSTASLTNEVMASVNDTQILRKDVDVIVNKLLEAQKVPAEQQAEARQIFEQRLISSIIIRTLIMKEVKKVELKITDEDRKKQLDRLEDLLKPRNMTMDQYFKDNPLGEEAARKEFEEGLMIDKFLEAKVLSASADTDDEAKVADDVSPDKRQEKARPSSETDPEKENRKRKKSQEAIQKYLQELKNGAKITTPAYPNMKL